MWTYGRRLGAITLVAVAACGSNPAGSGGEDSGTVVPRSDAGHAPADTGGGVALRDGGADAARAADAVADVTVHPDATSRDASSQDTGVSDSSGDQGAPGFDAGDSPIIGPPDTGTVNVDATRDGPPLDACGICDRTWVCNGFPDSWVSTGPQACADIRRGTAVATLYCEHGDTINYPDPTNNDGTWSVTATGLALVYNSLGGGTMEIDCVPPS